jgi:hypothetical protein
VGGPSLVPVTGLNMGALAHPNMGAFAHPNMGAFAHPNMGALAQVPGRFGPPGPFSFSSIVSYLVSSLVSSKINRAGFSCISLIRAWLNPPFVGSAASSIGMGSSSSLSSMAVAG